MRYEYGLNDRMARKLKIEYAGALYHVINRGNYRRPIFGTIGATRAFVAVLGQACGQTGWRLHSLGLKLSTGGPTCAT